MNSYPVWFCLKSGDLHKAFPEVSLVEFNFDDPDELIHFFADIDDEIKFGLKYCKIEQKEICKDPKFQLYILQHAEAIRKQMYEYDKEQWERRFYSY